MVKKILRERITFEIGIKLVFIYFNTSFINLPLIAGKSTILPLIAKLSGAQVLKFNPIPSYSLSYLLYYKIYKFNKIFQENYYTYLQL